MSREAKLVARYGTPAEIRKWQAAHLTGASGSGRRGGVAIHRIEPCLELAGGLECILPGAVSDKERRDIGERLRLCDGGEQGEE